MVNFTPKLGEWTCFKNFTMNKYHCNESFQTS